MPNAMCQQAWASLAQLAKLSQVLAHGVASVPGLEPGFQILNPGTGRIE